VPKAFFFHLVALIALAVSPCAAAERFLYLSCEANKPYDHFSLGITVAPARPSVRLEKGGRTLETRSKISGDVLTFIHAEIGDFERYVINLNSGEAWRTTSDGARAFMCRPAEGGRKSKPRCPRGTTYCWPRRGDAPRGQRDFSYTDSREWGA
jgi:hypothetical protein